MHCEMTKDRTQKDASIKESRTGKRTSKEDEQKEKSCQRARQGAEESSGLCHTKDTQLIPSTTRLWTGDYTNI